MREVPYGLSWAVFGLLSLSTAASGQKIAKPTADAAKRADVAFRAGVSARESGNLEVARQKFTEVVQLQPRIAEGHEALGTVLAEMGRPLDGAKEFEAAAKIKPGDQGIEINLALAYVQAGEASRAVPHFKAAESLSHQAGHAPVDASFYDAYGRALAGAGKPDEAKLQFVAEEALTGPRAEIEDALGMLDAQQSRWDEARKSVRACAGTGRVVCASSCASGGGATNAERSAGSVEYACAGDGG